MMAYLFARQHFFHLTTTFRSQTRLYRLDGVDEAWRPLVTLCLWHDSERTTVDKQGDRGCGLRLRQFLLELVLQFAVSKALPIPSPSPFSPRTPWARGGQGCGTPQWTTAWGGQRGRDTDRHSGHRDERAEGQWDGV